MPCSTVSSDDVVLRPVAAVQSCSNVRGRLAPSGEIWEQVGTWFAPGCRTCRSVKVQLHSSRCVAQDSRICGCGAAWVTSGRRFSDGRHGQAPRPGGNAGAGSRGPLSRAPVVGIDLAVLRDQVLVLWWRRTAGSGALESDIAVAH